jgi:uncharacterized membrane protein
MSQGHTAAEAPEQVVEAEVVPAEGGGRRRLFGSLPAGERKLAIAIAVISVIGVGIAGYLTYVHYAGIQPFCASGSHGCEKVQTSDYADLLGIPVAVLGLAGYIAILGSLFVRGDLGRIAGTVLALSGFGFSAYLTYRELFTIEAICQWCVASAVLMTALAVLTTVRLLKAT